MAATGRPPAGDRDTPKIPEVITGSPGGPDQDKHVENVITCSKPTGPDAPGSAMPRIANTITSTGPNK